LLTRLTHKWAYVISVAVLLAGTAVMLTVLTPGRDPVRSADALRSQGDYPSALDAYQGVLAAEPDDPEALWGVAQTHLARRDSAKALDYLNRYLQKHPKGVHVAEARAALTRVRGSYVDNRQPTPELAPAPGPALPPGPPPQLTAAWDRAAKLERHSRWLEAVSAYAAIAESAADGLTRAAAFERMARCEAQRSALDYDRIRHFYQRAERAYREAADIPHARRCQDLAYTAQEYARVKAEREKLARERREVAEKAREAVPAPEPRQVFEKALAALRAGDEQTAVQEARRIAESTPAAWYVIGEVHARRAAWDEARRELTYYLAKEPAGIFADEARRELAAMQGKRPLLLDDFLRGADRWRIQGRTKGAVPAIETVPGPEGRDSPCLRIDPGQTVYASFASGEVVTLRLRIRIPATAEEPATRVRFQPYGDEEATCVPLYVYERGLQFFGARQKPVPIGAGWCRLAMDFTKQTVSAQAEGQWIGEVPRDADLTGLAVTVESEEGDPVYLDDVRIVEQLPEAEGQRQPSR
jgi:tetratricopeptide (TPR) repeat protein